jgi:hypothetical protein
MIRSVLKTGDTREAFCENCERWTTQRLEKFRKGGSGQPGPQLWWCETGQHIVGQYPPLTTDGRLAAKPRPTSP